MAKQKRELLKFREGDVGMKIRKDGHLEIAGVKESGMINEKGMVNPILLFASAWARRDPKIFQALIDNFKESVRKWRKNTHMKVVVKSKKSKNIYNTGAMN